MPKIHTNSLGHDKINLDISNFHYSYLQKCLLTSSVEAPVWIMLQAIIRAAIMAGSTFRGGMMVAVIRRMMMIFIVRRMMIIINARRMII